MSGSPAPSLRIVVSGLAGLHPVGGVAWDYLQYALGFRRLGHRVVYHEDTWGWPYHPVARTRTREADYTVRFLGSFFERHAPELSGRWHYVHLREESFGMEERAWRDFARSADLFVNVSGASAIPEELPGSCVKLFLDTDPGYNQIVLAERPEWSENVDRWARLVADHDRHFTYAENIHAPDCRVPELGFEWRTTRMPIVLDAWTSPAPEAGAAWTTVMTWDAFPGPLRWRGETFGSKGVEFERFLDLPRRVDAPLRVALGGEDAPADRLREAGWGVVDGPSVTRTPEDYRAFIAGSRGEFSTAKQVYVALRTGWFSCRTACYLASGRPAVVQDTGFSGRLPTGEGLVAFSDPEGAAAGIRAVEADHRRHAAAARELAREHFASDRVLADLIEGAGTA